MINFDAFSKKMHNNTFMMNKILNIFVEKYKSPQSLFLTPYEEKDCDALFQNIHTLNGSACNFCDDETLKLFKSIEAHSKRGQLPPKSTIFALISAINETIKEIDQFIKNKPIE